MLASFPLFHGLPCRSRPIVALGMGVQLGRSLKGGSGKPTLTTRCDQQVSADLQMLINCGCHQQRQTYLLLLAPSPIRTDLQMSRVDLQLLTLRSAVCSTVAQPMCKIVSVFNAAAALASMHEASRRGGRRATCKCPPGLDRRQDQARAASSACSKIDTCECLVQYAFMSQTTC
jgi:hypothetical protein